MNYIGLREIIRKNLWERRKNRKTKKEMDSNKIIKGNKVKHKRKMNKERGKI
ncbi:MAG: hypothetical protein HFI34_04335 [Lachnospiraceae bacterium]|nr:hypothetical protein [Lachnospiraceae bacterium]